MGKRGRGLCILMWYLLDMSAYVPVQVRVCSGERVRLLNILHVLCGHSTLWAYLHCYRSITLGFLPQSGLHSFSGKALPEMGNNKCV
jgi:hypothetical protein